jgi:hypothetical protein
VVRLGILAEEQEAPPHACSYGGGGRQGLASRKIKHISTPRFS